MHNIKALERFLNACKRFVREQLAVQSETCGILQSVKQTIRREDGDKALSLQMAEFTIAEMIDDIFTGKTILQFHFFKKAV